MTTTRNAQQTGTETHVCSKCGMPAQKDWSGWTHFLPPMSTTERRKYRHVVKVQAS